MSEERKSGGTEVGERDTVVVRNCSWRYAHDLPLVVKDVELTVGRGQRLVLVGDNGAGKSTLLRLVAGKHMAPGSFIRVLGRNPDFDTSLNDEVNLISSSWGTRTVAFAAYGSVARRNAAPTPSLTRFAGRAGCRCRRTLR